MRVVVTGATGFIGRHVVTRLMKEPIALRTVSHRQLDHGIDPKVEAVVADLRNSGVEGALVKGADAVVHLAGIAHVRASAADYQQVNVEVASRLAQAAVRNGVRSFVLASSASVYGNCENEPLKEGSPCRPTTEYGKSKLQAEGAVARIAAGSDMSVVNLRLSTVYGAEDPGNVSRLIKAVRTFGPVVIGTGSNLKSLTYVGNIAELVALLVARELPHFDIVNVSDPDPYSLSALVSTVADVLRDKRPMTRIPLGVAMTGARVAELVCGVLGRKPPVSCDQVAKLTETAIIDVTHLRGDYGFTSPILLREGIERTLELGQ